MAQSLCMPSTSDKERQRHQRPEIGRTHERVREPAQPRLKRRHIKERQAHEDRIERLLRQAFLLPHMLHDTQETVDFLAIGLGDQRAGLGVTAAQRQEPVQRERQPARRGENAPRGAVLDEVHQPPTLCREPQMDGVHQRRPR